MDKKQLIEEVTAAFANTIYPGDDNIAGTKYDDLESAEIVKDLKGRKWTDVDAETLAYHSNSLPFFKPEGFAYYLPAFMLLSIQKFEDSDVAYNLLAALTPTNEKDLQKTIQDISASTFLNEAHKQEALTFLNEQVKAENISKSQSFTLSKYMQLTKQQSKVVGHFLQYLKQEYAPYFAFDEPQKAIDRYWGAFLD